MLNIFKKNIYKLTSNKDGNFLDGVGKIKLNDNRVIIAVSAGSKVVLTRDGNTFQIFEAVGKDEVIQGVFKNGDIYTLGKSDNFNIEPASEKLIVKIEKIEVENPEVTVKEYNFNDSTDKSRRMTLTIGLALLLLLVVSVIFGVNQKNAREFEKKSLVTFEAAEKEYKESLELFDIDKKQSREKYLSAKEKLLSLQESGYKNENLTKVIDEIKNNEGKIIGEVKVNTSEFLDLSLQINGFLGSQIASTSEEMFVFDRSSQNVIRVNSRTKNAEKVASSSDLKNSNSIASYESRLFSMNDEGIFEIKNGAKKVLDKDWSEGYFYLYAGNIYLIDKSENEIYRYSGSGSSFSDKTSWLAPGIEVDFSKIVDVSIDGTIWVLSETGKVSRFSNGNPLSITLSGVSGDLTNPTAIYTTENLKHVYVLDKNNGRVVVLEKNGNFKIQYVSDSIKNAEDLMVDEDGKKVILINKNKLEHFETQI